MINDEHLSCVLHAADSWRILMLQESGRAHELGNFREAHDLMGKANEIAESIWQMTPDAEADEAALVYADEAWRERQYV